MSTVTTKRDICFNIASACDLTGFCQMNCLKKISELSSIVEVNSNKIESSEASESENTILQCFEGN
jgi:hypothetical protein